MVLNGLNCLVRFSILSTLQPVLAIEDFHIFFRLGTKCEKHDSHLRVASLLTSLLHRLLLYLITTRGLYASKCLCTDSTVY